MLELYKAIDSQENINLKFVLRIKENNESGSVLNYFSETFAMFVEKLCPSYMKKRHELNFQKSWVKLYQNNVEKVQEYWRKYRYLTDIEKLVVFEGNKVLDVGCGISSLLNHIAGEKYGIDPLAEEYKKIFSYNSSIQIRQASGENIPFPPNSFDVVICSNALDHTINPRKVLVEIHKVLKKNGKLILTVEIILGKEKNKIRLGHPHNITLKELMALLNDFKILFHRSSPMIGLKNYVEYGDNFRAKHKEHILVCKPK